MRKPKKSSSLERVPFETLESRQLMSVVNITPGADIQGAINNSAPGDTIKFSPGTYNVGSTLSLAGNRTYQGNGAVLKWTGGNAVMAQLNGNGITLDGLVFDGSGVTANQVSNETITNCTFQNTRVSGWTIDDAIFFNGMSDSTVSHNNFLHWGGDGGIIGYNPVRSHFDDNNFSDVSEGMHINWGEENGQAMVSNSTFLRNVFSGIHRYALEFQGTANGLDIGYNWAGNFDAPSNTTLAFTLPLSDSQGAVFSKNIHVHNNFIDGTGMVPIASDGEQNWGFEIGGDGTEVDHNVVSGPFAVAICDTCTTSAWSYHDNVWAGVKNSFGAAVLNEFKGVNPSPQNVYNNQQLPNALATPTPQQVTSGAYWNTNSGGTGTPTTTPTSTPTSTPTATLAVTSTGGGQLTVALPGTAGTLSRKTTDGSDAWVQVATIASGTTTYVDHSADAVSGAPTLEPNWQYSYQFTSSAGSIAVGSGTVSTGISVTASKSGALTLALPYGASGTLTRQGGGTTVQLGTITGNGATAYTGATYVDQAQLQANVKYTYVLTDANGDTWTGAGTSATGTITTTPTSTPTSTPTATPTATLAVTSTGAGQLTVALPGTAGTLSRKTTDGSDSWVAVATITSGTTTYVDSGPDAVSGAPTLEPNWEYSYQFTSAAGSVAAGSGRVSTGIAVTAGKPGTLTLTLPYGASGTLTRQAADGSAVQIGTVSGNGPSDYAGVVYVDQGALAANVKYTYVLTDANGDTWTGSGTLTAAQATQTLSVAPTNPGELTVTLPGTAGTLWRKTTDGSDDWAQVATITSGTSTYVDNGPDPVSGAATLEPNWEYSYKFVGSDGSTLTASGRVTNAIAATATAPGVLTLTLPLGSFGTLTRTAQGGGAGIQLLKITGGGSSTYAGATFTDDGLNPDTVYTYTLAGDDGTQLVWSGMAQVQKAA